MSLTPNKSGKNRGNATQSNGKSSSSISSWCVIFALVIIFFVTGIYVGSLFVTEEELSQNASQTIGLPKTYNIINALNKEAQSFLRKELHEDLPTANKGENLRKETPSKSTSAPIVLKKNPSTPTTAKDTSLEKRQFSIPSGSTPTESRTSFIARENCYISGPADLDAESVLIAGWVFLDGKSIYDNDMRTIYSNKYPGCEASVKQNGISMYVNGWQSKDHKLYVEYGGSTKGCLKVFSDTEVSLNAWHHIASYVSPSSISLFLDGELIKEETIVDPHMVQTSNPFLFGQYSLEAPYTLYGNLSNFVVMHQFFSNEEVTRVMKSLYSELTTPESILALDNVFAYYPFDYHKKDKFAKDLKRNMHASYVCAGSGPDGIKIALVDGVNDRPVTDEMKAESDRLGQIRKQKIIDGMKHVWSGYKKYAWGRDELKPQSNSGQDNWGGIGMTILDSLDTLWLLGMKDEFYEAKKWVEKSLTFDRGGTVSVFEITIRALGGLLAAYDLSKERVFLDKAKQLGDKLIHAFNTRSGIPMGMINLASGSASNGWSGNSAILSELGTLQVEFRYLGHHTNTPSFEEVSMRPLKLMESKRPNNGLYPIKVRIDDGGFADNMVTFGALGDSFYEYLLKLWIQGGKKEQWLRDMYDRAMDGALSTLLMSSTPSGLAFFSDWNGHSNYRKMDHLVCFVPGMLALGAYTDPNGIESDRAQRDLKVAKALMYTCREMYHRTQTGIAPEYVEFPNGRDMVPAANAPFYILRPETAESLFILNQLTGDPIYRDWAWEIWEAIDRECRTGSGYGALRHVNNRNAGVDDRMESFFLAETVKYLYLAQDPDKPVDLMEKVFNTEAHPLPILK